jgi:hypothetical protein
MRLVQGDLPLLGPKALRYYLPPFIEFSLTHANIPGAYDYLRIHLCNVGSSEAWWLERFAVFSPLEKQAVAAYLEHLAQFLAEPTDRAAIQAAADLWKCA